MFVRLKKIALLALLLVLPMQGLAAAIAPLTCFSTGDHHGVQVVADTDHEHGASHHGSSSHDNANNTDSSGTSNAAGHLDCHHVFSGVPVTFLASAPPDLPVYQSNLSLLATLYIPELPQRPPRS